MVPESRVRSVRRWRRGRRVTGSAGSSLSSRAYLRPPLPRPPGVSVSERGCWEGLRTRGCRGAVEQPSAKTRRRNVARGVNFPLSLGGFGEGCVVSWYTPLNPRPIPSWTHIPTPAFFLQLISTAPPRPQTSTRAISQGAHALPLQLP